MICLSFDLSFVLYVVFCVLCLSVGPILFQPRSSTFNEFECPFEILRLSFHEMQIQFNLPHLRLQTHQIFQGFNLKHLMSVSLRKNYQWHSNQISCKEKSNTYYYIIEKKFNNKFENVVLNTSYAIYAWGNKNLIVSSNQQLEMYKKKCIYH